MNKQEGEWDKTRPSKNSEEEGPEQSDQLSIIKHPEEITSFKLPMMQTVHVPVKGNADITDRSQTWHSSSGVLAEMTIPENADDNNEKAEESLSHVREFDRPKQHSGEDVPEPTDHLSISKHLEEITSSSKLPMMQTVHVPVHGGEDIPNKGQMLQTWHPRSGALSGMPTIETAEESSDPSHSQELDSTSGHHAEENLAPSDHLSISRNPGDVASSSKLLMTQTMHGDAEIPNNRQNIFSKTMPASRSRETVKELSGKPRTISRPSQHSKEDVPELSDQLSISKHPEEITSSSKLQMRQTVHVPVQGDVDIPNKRQMLQTWHSGSGALAGMTIPEIAEDTNEKTEETLSHTRKFDRSSEEKGLELSENLSINKHPGGSASSSKLPMMQTVHVPLQGEEKIRNKRQMRQTWHPRSGDLSEKPTLESGEESSVPSHIQELDSTSEHHAEENLALSDHLSISRNPGEVASSSKLPMTQTVQCYAEIPNNRQNMLSKTMPASKSGETIKELSGKPRTISRRPKQHSDEEVPEHTDHLSISKHPEEITSSSKLQMMQTVHFPVQGDVDMPNKRQMLKTRHPRSSALSEMPTIGTGEESSDPSHSQELDR
ncbi:uncharacterized protein LOC128235976 [Mya arenaria]|uniref:uncharacterized protein LOC128235976 n=1 Tax=Mya arenaria TaxID=6604 RepID=UPI0022E47FD2|nr:uncharacterized protein LOC128235976 [Mya arenaria]